MADIIAEINTIGDLLGGVGASRFYKQNLPATYVANTIGIRWQGDNSESETGFHYRVDRLYQVIYFGSNEVNCLGLATKLTAALAQNTKAKIRDSSGFITLGSFALSAPFKTETDGVYAIIGILPVSVRVPREFEKAPKMAEVTVEATPKDHAGTAIDDGRYRFSTEILLDE